jgi:hypothetical protein
MILTKPRGSLLMSALALAANGNYDKAASAISGSVKMADAALS